MPGALSCAAWAVKSWLGPPLRPPPSEECQLSTYHVPHTLSPSSTERVSWLLPGAWHRASPSHLGSEVPVAVRSCRLQPSLHKGAGESQRPPPQKVGSGRGLLPAFVSCSLIGTQSLSRKHQFAWGKMEGDPHIQLWSRKIPRTKRKKERAEMVGFQGGPGCPLWLLGFGGLIDL